MIIALLGVLGVLAALIGSLMLALRGISVARNIEVRLESAAGLQLAGASAAMAALLLALATDDFSIVYTANHHAVATPFPFDFATAWAALEGSIVLWGLVLAGFTWAAYKRYASTPDRLGGAALAVLGAVGIFFFGLIATVANPFEVCVQAAELGCVESSPWIFSTLDVPSDGPGPNPLLQNHFMMAIHPPMLYLGYVGLTVPFAYAIGSLALNQDGDAWLRRSHRSTLVAWSFLTAGIVLGGWWAYEVLSWGGYWAWDPVENASFMPWLVATAFLHSALVQRRRGALQAWNYILVISGFALTILGTFLTRSGTINSVHSFTQSAIGPVLLAFLALVVVGSFVLFSMRAGIAASQGRIDSMVSREGTFLVNNLLLSIYAFIVLIGTVYPLVLEAFTGTQVGVGEPFFNRLAVPVSFLLLLVMGFGPITPWRSPDGAVVWERARRALAIGMIAGLITALTVTRLGWVVLAATLGTFVVAAIVGLAVEHVGARVAKTDESPWIASKKVLGGDKGFWGGQLSHIGVVLIAVGMAFAANLADHTEVDLRQGESTQFADHTFTFESPFQRTSPSKTEIGSRVTVTRHGEFVGVLEPSANFFGNDPNGISTPDVLHKAGGDIYLTQLTLPVDETVRLGIDTSPLIWLLWVGGGLAALGGVVSLGGRRSTLKPRVPERV